MLKKVNIELNDYITVRDRNKLILEAVTVIRSKNK